MRRLDVSIIAIMFILTILFTGIVFQNSPLKKAEQMLSLGEKYLGELDYENAVLNFQKAYDIMPRNRKLVSGIADNLEKMLDDAENADDIDTKLLILKEVSEFKADDPKISAIVLCANEKVIEIETAVESENHNEEQPVESIEEEGESVGEELYENSSTESTDEQDNVYSENSNEESVVSENEMEESATETDEQLNSVQMEANDLAQYLGMKLSDVSRILPGKTRVYDHAYYSEEYGFVDETIYYKEGDYELSSFSDNIDIIKVVRTDWSRSAKWNICGVTTQNSIEEATQILEQQGWKRKSEDWGVEQEFGTSYMFTKGNLGFEYKDDDYYKVVQLCLYLYG